MKKFLYNNIIVWIFSLLFITVECLAVCFTGGNPLLTKIWYVLMFLVFIDCILILTKSMKAKAIVSGIILFIQAVLAVGMVYLFESNGTYFDFGMLNQRNDAFGTIEDLALNIPLLSICLIALAIFAVSCVFYIKGFNNRQSLLIKTAVKVKQDNFNNKKQRKKIKNKHYSINPNKLNVLTKLFIVGCMLITISMSAVIPIYNTRKHMNESYISILYSNNHSKYQQYGITGNAIYEMFTGLSGDTVDISNISELDKKIYSNKLATSEYNGVSKGNNLIFVLVESWEWYAWLNDWYDEATLREVYPNLYKFMDSSLVLNNFHAREKTDTSEILTILGSNPTGKYVHYDFPNNEYPYSLPNMFRSSVEENGNTVKQIRSYHQNQGSFYNRNKAHKSFGFDRLVDINEMMDYGVKNTWKGIAKRERTLDSLTWEKMIDQMVPSVEANEQFMTYAISFTMHGYYVDRYTLKDGYKGENYYQTLADHGMYPKGKNKKDNYMRTYAACVMDFDRALGILMNELESKGLSDNTTVVLCSDHNTYYNNLSYHAKDIDVMYDSELYRIPCMIYDTKLTNAIKANNPGVQNATTISKFTTTSDLIPTLFDIFGIPAWDSLYLGNSVLIPEVESIIYSRAYGLFVTDKIICYSIKDPLFTKDFDENARIDFIKRAEHHLTELELIDKIYYSNYFSKYDYIPAS